MCGKIQTNELIKLREIFDNAHMRLYGYFWNSIKMFITLVATLISIQSGFLLYFSNSKGNLALIIIPAGVIGLCFIAWINAKKEYRGMMEQLSCVAKIDDELELKRTKKTIFKNEDYILPKRWLEGRKHSRFGEHTEVQQFIDFNLTRWTSAYGIGKAIVIVIVIMDVLLLLFSISRIFS